MDRTSEEFLAEPRRELRRRAASCCSAPTGRATRPPWTRALLRDPALAAAARPSAESRGARARRPVRAGADPRRSRSIVRRGEGNPFFLEELAHGPCSTGRRAGPRTPSPGTVAGRAAWRAIDRLADEPRRVLQTASVLGREFSLRAARAPSGSGPADLDAAPRGAQAPRVPPRAGRRGTSRATSSSTPSPRRSPTRACSPRRRKALHAAAARALEALYQGRLEQVYDRLAHHWYRAEEPQQAVEYLSRFAEQAAGAYAHAEAAEALRKALSQVEGLPPETRARRRIEIVLALARSLYFMGRFPESLAAPHRARRGRGGLRRAGPHGLLPFLARPHPEPPRRRTSGSGAACGAGDRGGRRAGDSGTVGRAHYVLSREGFWSGELAAGAEHGRQAVAWLDAPASGGVERLERATGAPWWLAQSHCWWGINQFQQRRLRARARRGRAGTGDRGALGDLPPRGLRRLPERLVPHHPR